MTIAIATETITVRVPFRVRRQGGRKVIEVPEGLPGRPAAYSPLVRALARAFRWQRMLESGEVTTIGDLATAERLHPTYVSRLLRLTELPPRTIEQVLDGTINLKLADLLGSIGKVEYGSPWDWSSP